MNQTNHSANEAGAVLAPEAHSEYNVNKLLLWASAGIVVVALIGVVFGTFGDLAIAETVYRPENLFWRVVTALGMFPFLGLYMFYLGTLCRQAVLSHLSPKKKTLAVIVSAYLGLSTAVIGSWAMCRTDTLGAIFPQVVGSIPAIAAGAVCVMTPLFFVGYFVSKREYDVKFIKQLIVLCVVMAIALYCMEILKLFFCRPRYRLLLRDIPGITFTPWYKRFAGSAVFVTEYGIDSNDFKSFPSGHTMLAMALIYALPPLARATTGKESHKLPLFAFGALIAIFVGLSRMFLGAHFLSDVSMGTCISAVFGIIVFAFNLRKSPEESGTSSGLM